MKSTIHSLVAGSLIATVTFSASAAEQVRLITLDPGHFHAGLVQKFMYPQVSPAVHVYAPEGPEVKDHLKRVESFNTRAENPTKWEQKVYTGPDFLERMLREKPGNVVVLAGNNARKTEYIDKSVKAGLNVLADKPMAITPEGFSLLRKVFDRAEKKGVLVYDIMTERFEITSILQRELAQSPQVFGAFEKGTPEQPAVVKESVHHFFKEVAGKPLVRPPWFFDSRQQGEAVPDVGTHLVDLVQWQCFPEQTLDWRKDIQVLAAKRWPTRMTAAQFKQVTGLDQFPDYLKKEVGPDGVLNAYHNGDVIYTLRGIHVKVGALWNYEAPPGTKDTHYSLLRGTRANLVIKQGKEQNFVPTLYVESKGGGSAADFETALRGAIARIHQKWPGVDVKSAGASWQVIIPAKYVVSHEEHFGQVTERFLQYLAVGKLPDWEVPNMLAKYYTTTEAYRLSHRANKR